MKRKMIKIDIIKLIYMKTDQHIFEDECVENAVTDASDFNLVKQPRRDFKPVAIAIIYYLRSG